MSRLPALEYVSLPVATWRTVIDEGLIPGSLHAVGFEDAGRSDVAVPFTETIEIANLLLKHRAQPTIEVVRVSGGPLVGHPAQDRCGGSSRGGGIGTGEG